MTGPPLDPMTPQQTPRQFAGRRRFGGQSPQSPQGDGGYQANGGMQMPSQPVQPGQAGQTAQYGQPGTQGAHPMHRQGGSGYQTNRPPAPQNAQGGAPQPPPTFAQMQANGQARPAPPQIQQQQMPQSFGGGGGGVGGDLQAAVQQALQNPSAYGSKQVMDTYNMLNQQLSQDYGYQQKHLNDEMASRGLSESTIAGQRYSDLATEQARAQANMATQLANQAALTYGQDRSSAINSGLGLGNLGLAQQLGMGNLGVAQQNASTGAQSVANQYTLGQGQLGLGQQGQDLAKTLGLGNLGLGQQSQDLARQLGVGNLNLNQQQLAQQGSQFNQDLGLRQQQNAQQFGLQQADLTGRYNGQNTLAANAQTMAQQQFQQQLAQQLGLATMSDKTANRGIDQQGNTQLNQLLMQLAMMGIGSGSYGGYGGGGGATGGSAGGAGGTGQSTVPPAMQQILDNHGLEQSNPQLYATTMLASGKLNGPNIAGGTVNFGGKQYTVKEYYTLMAQHPELFGVQHASNSFTLDGPQQGGGPSMSDLVKQMQAEQAQNGPDYGASTGRNQPSTPDYGRYDNLGGSIVSPAVRSQELDWKSALGQFNAAQDASGIDFSSPDANDQWADYAIAHGIGQTPLKLSDWMRQHHFMG